MFKTGDFIQYNGRLGVITYIYQEEVYVKVEHLEIMVKREELALYTGDNQKTDKVFRYGYALKPEMFSLDSFGYLDSCMEYPHGLTDHKDLDTHYFGGFAVPEILEFIEWFNTNYSFATISIETENHVGVVGISGNKYGAKLYLGAGNSFIEVVLKIKLKWANQYITKLLCVLLRTFFVTEQYQILKLRDEFSSTDIFEQFLDAIDSGYERSHYFNEEVNIKVALDFLEERNWRRLKADMYSQTDIYKHIMRLRK